MILQLKRSAASILKHYVITKTLKFHASVYKMTVADYKSGLIKLLVGSLTEDQIEINPFAHTQNQGINKAT